MNGFIDNVATLVVEHCLVDELSTLFNPDIVSDMDDATLERLAAESAEQQEERRNLHDKLSTLREGLAICLIYDDVGPAGMHLSFVNFIYSDVAFI